MFANLLYRGPSLDDLHNSYAKVGRVDPEAPVRAAHQVCVSAPPEAVWKLLCDPRGWPDVDPAIRDVTLTGVAEVDSEFRWRRGPARMRSRYAVLTPGREVTWTGTSAGVRAVHRHTMEPDGAGRTLLSSEESLAGRMVALYYPTSKLQADLVTWLDLVREAAECRPAQDGC